MVEQFQQSDLRAEGLLLGKGSSARRLAALYKQTYEIPHGLVPFSEFFRARDFLSRVEEIAPVKSNSANFVVSVS